MVGISEMGVTGMTEEQQKERMELTKILWLLRNNNS
jgi:hypothetical protein